MASTIVVYHRKFKKYFGGNGWVNKLPMFLITRYDTVQAAQEACDAFRLSGAAFDREKARLPEYECCEVRDLIGDVLYSPPPLTDNKYVFERQWPKTS